MQLNETVLANNEFIQYLNAKKYVSRQRSKHAYSEMTGTAILLRYKSFSFAVCLQSRGNENQISLR